MIYSFLFRNQFDSQDALSKKPKEYWDYEKLIVALPESHNQTGSRW